MINQIKIRQLRILVLLMLGYKIIFLNSNRGNKDNKKIKMEKMNYNLSQKHSNNSFKIFKTQLTIIRFR